MWSASLPLTTNPFLDDHLIYALFLVLLALIGAGNTLGFGGPVGETSLRGEERLAQVSAQRGASRRRGVVRVHPGPHHLFLSPV